MTVPAKYLEEKARTWLMMPSRTWECPQLRQHGSAHPIFYEGISGTRVFAWIGLPKGASEHKKVPGIVLIHGGGGTAFSHWVNIWTERGYAAIAMDTCGSMPLPDCLWAPAWPRHDYSGPSGWGAFEKQLEMSPEHQWFTHAVSAVMLGCNLLCSLPEVDPDRIGVTGVSWGGVLALISAGIDSRYRAVCPVYSCGFLYENEDWFSTQTSGASEASRRWWREQWDPANFIGSIQCPILWLASTNDGSIFYPCSWQKSTELAGSFSRHALLIRLKHSHGPCSEEQKEIFRFFDEHLCNAKPQLRLTTLTEKDGHLCTYWQGSQPAGALVTFTVDTHKDWFLKEWLELPATVTEKGTIEADLPEYWQAAYLTAMADDLTRVTTGYAFSHTECT